MAQGWHKGSTSYNLKAGTLSADDVIDMCPAVGLSLQLLVDLTQLSWSSTSPATYSITILSFGQPSVKISQELAEIMKSGKKPNKDFLVVDVRDDDYAGGNIKSSLNLPSNEFLMNVDGLVKKANDIPVVIFHCALSQAR